MATYKLIGCKIFERELASVTYNCKNAIDTTLIRMSIHIRPKELSRVLQEEIDAVDNNTHIHSNSTEYFDFDAILLAYGLCSYVSLGLSSKRYPLVIPKVHDCISVLMGDKKRYDEYYASHSRTFFGSCGYSECMRFSDDDRYNRRFQFYLDRYKGNEKRARKAVDIEQEFTSQYDNFTYIGWEGLELPEYEAEAQEYAKREGWSYEKVMGNNSMLKHLVDGDWNEDDYLIVPPGQCIGQCFDGGILKAMTLDEFWESRQ